MTLTLTKNNLCSDETYDLVLEKLKEVDPNNSLINTIGNLPTKNKVKLPYHMGSMNKFKTEKQLTTGLKPQRPLL